MLKILKKTYTYLGDKVKYFKYQSCENSFLITSFLQNIDYSNLAIDMCNKYNCDGLLVFDKEKSKVLIYNSDGSEANMCGNGLKCLMHYCFDNLCDKKCLKFNTRSGIYKTSITSFNPFTTSVDLKKGSYYLDFKKKKYKINQNIYEISAYYLGVLHVVLVCNDFDDVLPHIGSIKNDKTFEIEPNINIVKIIDKNSFEIITHERGVGWSRSCATGVGATAYILHKEYGLNDNLVAITPGGVMRVNLSDGIVVSSSSRFIAVYEEQL